MKPEHYRKLAAAGLDVDQIGIVMDIMAESEAALKAAEEARKSVARERVQRWREKNKADVTLQKRNGNATVRLTRAEDSSSTQEISGKEVKEERTSPPARSARGSRIPDDFKPDIEAAVSEGLSMQEAQRQALSFCDYWRSKPGKDAIKLDWPATWRIWFRRRLDDRPPQTAPPRTPPKGRDFNDILDELQGKNRNDVQPGPVFDASVNRADFGGAPGVVQLHALPARR